MIFKLGLIIQNMKDIIKKVKNMVWVPICGVMAQNM